MSEYRVNKVRPVCANCEGSLPPSFMMTVDGKAVCDRGCADGWRNGLEHLKFLEVVRGLRALVSDGPPTGTSHILSVGEYWGWFFHGVQVTAFRKASHARLGRASHHDRARPAT